MSRCDEREHEWADVTTFEDPLRVETCIRCGLKRLWTR